jgi:SAM-dependent methyltransferase
MFHVFMEQFNPGRSAAVLDVGVTSDTFYPESNCFEQMYPYPWRITCVGTEDGSHLMVKYPGLKYVSITAGQPLPFQDLEFDIVFSNAVLEHVGSRDDQRRFLAEICRVGKSFFITTPNRWFPIEHHTGLPFVHYLPSKLFRSILKATKFRYWASESTLNILTAAELKNLFPSNVNVDVHMVRFGGFGSNLIAYGGRT